jgi:hypothetical protein
MTDADATLLAAAVGLISGGIGILGTYAGALRITQKNRRSDANIVFYESFRKAIRDFQSTANPPTEPQHILSYHLEDHRAAVYRFKFFLEGGERRCFLAAWEDYYKQYKDKAFADNGEKDKRPEKRQLALNHIYKLLSFAGYEKE